MSRGFENTENEESRATDSTDVLEKILLELKKLNTMVGEMTELKIGDEDAN